MGQKFPRDKIGEGTALFLQKAQTDRVLNCLESLMNMQVTGGKFVCTEKNTVLQIGGDTLKDMIVVLNGTGYYTNILTDGRLEEI